LDDLLLLSLELIRERGLAGSSIREFIRGDSRYGSSELSDQQRTDEEKGQAPDPSTLAWGGRREAVAAVPAGGLR
jgi:hypothetical protein